MRPRGYTIERFDSQIFPRSEVRQLGRRLRTFFGPDSLDEACRWVNSRLQEDGARLAVTSPAATTPLPPPRSDLDVRVRS
jgi:hypothetical protein